MSAESFLAGKVTLHRGDCLEVLPLLEANSIDSCVTDPPYHLTSIVKRFGKENSAPINNRDEQEGRQGPYHRASKGFMGKQWDGGDIAFRPELWAEVLRVLKPGAHLLAFSSTRTYHRMACAIEDAGFEIRDQIGWCYGSGFPKSHNIGDGWGSALKPAWEPICLARKPLSESSIAANVLKHGTGGINVEACRVGKPSSECIADDSACLSPIACSGFGYCRLRNFEQVSTHSRGKNGAFPKRPSEKTAEESGRKQDQREGLDHSKRTGRWPANLIHDGSEEVLAGFPDAGSNSGTPAASDGTAHRGTAFFGNKGTPETRVYDSDRGSAARFFYTAKADADDRLGSKHPTVKPIDLIQYLVRLVTPRGGVVLDPFAGTGTCGEAAFREGMAAVLIEREQEYQADIVKRMGLCLSGPEERRAASIRQLPPDDLPMFGGGI
jgi:site-specific DNA-methyltransferase (adenine-specific)